MKAEHVKTPETTEEVSSHPGETGLGGTKRHRNTPCAREKPRADWKRDLQICGAGRKSRTRPTLVVGQKPYGKSQVNYALFGWMNDLGHNSEGWMETVIWTYKMTVKSPIWDNGDWRQAMAFAKAGYRGWPLFSYPPIPNPPTKYSVCLNCGRSYNADLDSVWPHPGWNYIWW
jgi:hypothetical protein